MDREALLERYLATRRLSVELCGPLAPEDYRIQSMPAVSPPWWNLGHTTWFFAKNLLEPFSAYTPDDAKLEYVLNSYYTALGPRIAQEDRGKMSRPTTDQVLAYRASVDRRMEELIRNCRERDLERISFLVETGVQHEQQHQELLLTEVKHIYATNPPPLRPVYRDAPPPSAAEAVPARWVGFEGGTTEIGNVEGGWCWDNELPVHRAYVAPFALQNRLVTCGEFLEFIEDGGYGEPLLWLSNGHAAAREEGWRAPLYWEERDGEWWIWTLSGERPLNPAEPVCHVSFYEADAYARWRSNTFAEDDGARLPTEEEWEHAARVAGFRTDEGNLLDARRYHPGPAPDPTAAASAGEPDVGRGDARDPGPNGTGDADGPPLRQLAGDVWEWTSSHYEPYPGFRPFPGSLQEYNGKFMDNQRVLRGGSCATPASHIRPSYRNFWAPATRFQFTGLRLAKTAR